MVAAMFAINGVRQINDPCARLKMVRFETFILALGDGTSFCGELSPLTDQFRQRQLTLWQPAPSDDDPLPAKG